jgi:ATP-binding cassette subfamily B protein
MEETKKSDLLLDARHIKKYFPVKTGMFKTAYVKAVDDVSFAIRRGETFAVIGATGCGKSSLVHMIPRFYDATEGEVLVEGVPVGEWDLPTLRRRIGYVMQKSELFSDTIAGNLRWGDAEATDDAIRHAAKIAQADGFIESFGEGYQTMIAEKGASLSGGQKQRLSIARALVRKPDILILDDATSALDLATEAKLQKALREELSDTTVVLIAQRIASVRNADRIAVIENGTVVGCASHDELLRTCPAYLDIYRSQVKESDKEGGAAV